MVGRLVQVARSTYQYPLIFKQLWHTPLLQAADRSFPSASVFVKGFRNGAKTVACNVS